MAEHAKLSASSSHRWLNCGPSVRLEESFENTTTDAAEQGTAAHALSEYKLRKFLKIKTKKPASKYDSKALEFYTDAYVDYACELITEAYTRSNDPLVLVEQRLDYTKYAEEGFGTGDLVIVSDGILDVVDLKFGMVRVSANDNPQLKLYALGALDLFDLLYDIELVRMTICQPRLDSISTFELSVDKLLEWAETELKPKAVLAFRGEGEFKSGEHCRYCRASNQCRVRANSNLELAKLDFKEPELLTDEEMAVVLAKVKVLAAWAKDVWEYAEKEAKNGKKWPGYKVVEVKGRSKYTDEAKIAERVLATGNYDETQIYTKNLVGVTAMKQLLGKKQFKELLGDLYTTPPGNPALVVESDKRPEWSPLDAAKRDFTDVEKG
jgi:hypothetical protein